MAKEKKSKISYFQSNFTSTTSVMLVLLLVGVVAFLGVLAKNFSNEIKENIGFNVILPAEADAGQIEQLDNMFKDTRRFSRSRYISAAEAAESWKRDTGEDLISLFGVNPLGAEFEVYVKAAYAHPDSLAAIERQLKAFPYIDEVAMHKAEVDAANRNLSNIAVVLLSVAALLLVISFVLINNTVRLTIYSRRFLIHTMKLVGAKPSFIRRPFIVSNMLNGLIAAAVAIAILVGAYFSLNNIDATLLSGIDLLTALAVFGALILIGVSLTALAALLAANKYINLSYDELFKR